MKNEKLDAEFSVRAQELLDDERTKEARSKRQLPAELDYQLAKRDIDFTEVQSTCSTTFTAHWINSFYFSPLNSTRISEMQNASTGGESDVVFILVLFRDGRCAHERNGGENEGAGEEACPAPET